MLGAKAAFRAIQQGPTVLVTLKGLEPELTTTLESSATDGRHARGRKSAAESRAPEIRQVLLTWIQIPAGERVSLRALARQLRTSHQLLGHYLAGLDKWRSNESYRSAKKQLDSIRAAARSENRSLTPLEKQRVQALSGQMLRAMAMLSMLGDVKKIEIQALDGPLHPADFKILEMYSRAGVPGAQKLLLRREEIGVKRKKPFAQIVRKTPRLEGETPVDWMRRIWDVCDKYDTNVPRVMTLERLERLSRSKSKATQNNLPADSADAAKPCRFA